MRTENLKKSILLRGLCLAVAFFVANTTHATIVYSGVMNLTLSGESQLYLDLDTGTVAASIHPDVEFSIRTNIYGSAPAVVAESRYTRLLGDPHTLFAPPSAVLDFATITRLNAGDPIIAGPTTSWSESAFLRLDNLGWAPGTDGFIGLYNHECLGWLHISYHADQSATLHGFAYANQFEPLNAGQTAIPEPSTVAFVAGILTSLASVWLKRGAKPQHNCPQQPPSPATR